MKEKIKKLLNITKEHFILILGTGLFVYNLFSFSSSKYCDSKAGLPSIGECSNPTTFYFYKDLTLIFLTLGAIFIVIGLIRLKRRNSE